jgi:hypothetical protein
MSKRTITSIAVVCLIVGIFAGVAGAQIVQYKIANSGLATVNNHETIKFHFTLDDVPGTPPAVVQMQLLNENGAVMGSKIVTLNAGQSATLEGQGPGLRRAHADVVDSVPQITTRRNGVGSVEIHDTLTAVVRHVCSFDHVGVGGGRN